MKARPEPLPRTRLCLVLTGDELKAYGNSEAFLSLARQLEWIASSDPKENYECHVRFILEDDESVFENKKPRNVWFLADVPAKAYLDNVEAVTPLDADCVARGFELTFMMVPESALDELATLQDSGLFPVEKTDGIT